MEAPRYYFGKETCHTDSFLHQFHPLTTKLLLGKDQSSRFYPCVPAFATPSSSTQRHQLELKHRQHPPMMFILGMGFVGQFFAQFLKTQQVGWTVTGTCTSLTKKKQLEERRFDVCLFNANEPELNTLNALKSYTHLLVSIPPLVGVGDPVYMVIVVVLWWMRSKWPLWVKTVFLLSAVDTIVRQRPLSKGQKMRMSRQYTSRVHVEDICQVLKASICMPSSRRIYNVVDDDPAPREDVFAYAEKLIEKKWPGTVKRRTSLENEFPINMSTSSGEKRVSNARMKSELGLRLLHPSYRSGLGSIVDKMQKPFEHGPSCS